MGTSYLEIGRRRKEMVLILVALIILASFALRWLWIPTKDTITHDEAISYLSASCHQGSFENLEYSAIPVQASEWKDYLRVDEKLCFTQIKDDLAATDRHPPVYFWALHIWALLVGIDSWTGPALNSFIAAITVALLFAFATELLKSRKDGLIVTFTYGLSIAVVGISFVARYHDLLTVLVLLLVWISIRLTEPEPSRFRWLIVALVIITLLGSLTHFFFAIAITGTIVFSLVRLIPRYVKRWLTIVAAILFGFLLARFIFPFEVVIFRDLGQVHSPPSIGEIGGRIIVTLFSFYQFAPLLLMALITVGIAFWYRMRGRDDGQQIGGGAIGQSGKFILFYLFWLSLGIITLYLSFVLPAHAMGETRLGMVWPFLSFLPVFVLRLFHFRGTLLLYFIIIPILFVSVFVIRTVKYTENDPAATLEGSSLIIIDNPARGMISQILWFTPDDANIIIGTQEFLLKNADGWLDSLETGSLYVSDISYSSTEQGRTEILTMMERTGIEAEVIGRLPTQKPPLDAVVYELSYRD